MRRSHPAIAIITMASLMAPSIPIAAPTVYAQARPATPAPAPVPTPTKAAGTTPAPSTTAQASGTAAAAPVDGGWPRQYGLKGGGSLTVYQPQVSSWDQRRHIVAFSAVSYTAKAGAKPALGTVKFEANTSVSTAERMVSLQGLKIAETNFPTIEKEQLKTVAATLNEALDDSDRIIALDRVLANMDKSQIIPKNIEGIKADPPNIFFSKTSAVIVNLDGEPIWSPIQGNDLKYAVNTNWDLFQHDQTKALFLRNNNTWLKAAELKGPWTPAGKLPESFTKLPADANFKEVKAAVPGAALKTAPNVFVTQTPGELILLTGEPNYLLVDGTSNLLWVSNTESDVFRIGRNGAVYYLVAGRWFSAPDFTGPWTFATLSLPADFKKMSLEHPRSRVLASVPGTDQAAEAVLIAQIPQTARVNRKELKAPDLAYNGEPQFQPIEKTTVMRAVNTDKDVFKVGNEYYMCTQGVWFVGKSATGPWEVANFVPEEIYKIPVSSPAHHVTYVTVEDDDDDNDEWVVFASAAAYTGVMVAWGCAVWGSGWYYPPYYGYGGFYPYYYPHFPTYGYSAWYNPYTGAYGRSAGVYGPYGGAGVGARYNPRTGTYARGAAAYGPYGTRSVAQAYNPRTGTYAQTRQGSNVYGSWGSTAVQRGDDWARTNRYTNNRTGTTTRTVRTDEGSAISRRGPGGGTVVAGDGGNIYAGNDGNVYRRQDGTWQKHENGGWSDTARQPERPANLPADRGTVDQLNRDSAARREGTTRTRDYGTYNRGSSGTTRTSPGSYRGGGGGGFRGGGGRRR